MYACMYVYIYIYIYVHRHDILRRPQLFKVKSDLEEPLQKLLEGLEQAADTVNVGDRRLMVPKCWRKWGPTKKWVPYVRYSITFQVNQVAFQQISVTHVLVNENPSQTWTAKNPDGPSTTRLVPGLGAGECSRWFTRVTSKSRSSAKPVDPLLDQTSTDHFFVLNIFKHPVLFQDDIATLTACSFFGQRVSRVHFSRT